MFLLTQSKWKTIRYQLSFFYSLEHNFFIKIIAKSVQFHAKIGKKVGT